MTYDGVDLWEIKAGVALPAPTDVSVRGEAGIRSDGDFDHAGAEVDFGQGVGPFGPSRSTSSASPSASRSTRSRASACRRSASSRRPTRSR